MIGGKAVVTGSCTVRVLVGADEIKAVDTAIPFRCEIKRNDGASDTADVTGRCEISVGAVTAHIDGGKVAVTVELTVCCLVMGKNKIRYVSSCELMTDRSVAPNDCAVRMYYPENGDTMWSIAKKYHVPLGEFVRANGSELGGGPVIV